jgi:hypothetical protein
MAEMMEQYGQMEQTQNRPQPLYAILYFHNGERLQLVGERGEIATFNLSNAEHYITYFCVLLGILCFEHGSILIREEHFARLHPCLHPYFQPYRAGEGNGEQG